MHEMKLTKAFMEVYCNLITLELNMFIREIAKKKGKVVTLEKSIACFKH